MHCSLFKIHCRLDFSQSIFRPANHTRHVCHIPHRHNIQPANTDCVAVYQKPAAYATACNHYQRYQRVTGRLLWKYTLHILSAIGFRSGTLWYFCADWLWNVWVFFFSFFSLCNLLKLLTYYTTLWSCHRLLKSQGIMTSSNGNIFHITGPLYREFTGHPDEMPLH